MGDRGGERKASEGKGKVKGFGEGGGGVCAGGRVQEQ